MEHYYQNIGEDWFTFPNLYKNMVEIANDDSLFIEIGSWKGRSACFMGVEILNSNKNIKLHCIDHWEGSKEHNNPNKEHNDSNYLYNIFLNNINPLKNIITPIRKNSIEASKMYANNSIDFIFIDGSHDYMSVYNDINYWLPKLKKDGIIAGHDYEWSDDVKSAVHEFFNIDDLIISEGCWIFKPIRDITVDGINKLMDINYNTTIEEIFNKFKNRPSDINEHLVTLYLLAKDCEHITEMGSRYGLSTFSILAAKRPKFIAYDLNINNNIQIAINKAKKENINFEFIQKNVLDVDIEQTDMLFIDTWHRYDQLREELQLHSGKVNKYIVLHDTTSYGYSDEPNWGTYVDLKYLPTNKVVGLWSAIEEFIEQNHNWEIFVRYTHNNGLTILRKK
jgi:predicted O-methyltransferase YrrM